MQWAFWWGVSVGPLLTWVTPPIGVENGLELASEENFDMMGCRDQWGIGRRGTGEARVRASMLVWVSRTGQWL